MIGYCLGGTLLACTLAYLAAKRERRIAAASFFAALTDFENPGELGVFIDEEQLAAMDQMMARRGFLEGREMATTFNMLRANDLIWSFVVNNYLLGKEPFPFDLLYWNSDSTRMPYAMHSFYLHKFYQENRLVERGGITLCGVPIDLRKIRLPVYMLSTREDHIAPWAATYAATQLYRGDTRFVLAGSGHIAGVVNPPSQQKYGYWTNERLPPDPDDWLDGATEHAGSWWPDWAAWNAAKSGPRVPARQPGDGAARAARGCARQLRQRARRVICSRARGSDRLLGGKPVQRDVVAVSPHLPLPGRALEVALAVEVHAAEHGIEPAAAQRLPTRRRARKCRRARPPAAHTWTAA